MALSRRGGGRGASEVIWPGFVDAMTALLMVLMFVLTIFMVVQSVLRETITTQDHELDELTAQVASLADALGLERNRANRLQGEIGQLSSALTAAQERGDAQAALVASLTGQLSAVRRNWRRRPRGLHRSKRRSPVCWPNGTRRGGR